MGFLKEKEVEGLRVRGITITITGPGSVDDGCWVLGAGCGGLGAGGWCLVLGAGCWVLAAGDYT